MFGVAKHWHSTDFPSTRCWVSNFWMGRFVSHKMWEKLITRMFVKKIWTPSPSSIDVWYLCRISLKDICTLLITLLICCPRLSPGQSSERRYISVRKNPIFDGGRGPDVGGFVFLRCDRNVESSYMLSSQWCFSHHFHWDESMTCVLFLGTRVASRERWVYIHIPPNGKETENHGLKKTWLLEVWVFRRLFGWVSWIAKDLLVRMTPLRHFKCSLKDARSSVDFQLPWRRFLET